MFCSHCGSAVDVGTGHCPACGKALLATVSEKKRGPALEAAKAASGDALQALKQLALDPVGGLAAAYNALDSRRAVGAAVGFAAIFALCVLVTVLSIKPGFVRLDFVDYLKLLIFTLVPPVAASAACLLARLAFRGSGGYEGDAFVGCATVLPLGVLCPLAATVGASNVEVVAILLTFALAYSILILYAGCVHISTIRTSLAAPAVPLILLVTAWFSSILARFLIGNLVSRPSLF